MLTQAQRNAVFVNMGTAYTVGGHAYTALKTYKSEWSGELTTPVIMLNYLFDATALKQAIGTAAEWDTARLTVDVFANTDNTNGVHGIKMSREIARTLILWFKLSADAALASEGVKAIKTHPARDLSHIEEKVYRIHFEVDLLYKLI